MATERDALLNDMRRLGLERKKARARAFGLTHELAPLVRRAHELDVAITEIAAATGLSRPAIYRILKGEAPTDGDAR